MLRKLVSILILIMMVKVRREEIGYHVNNTVIT
jgi:hypothetical protein